MKLFLTIAAAWCAVYIFQPAALACARPVRARLAARHAAPAACSAVACQPGACTPNAVSPAPTIPSPPVVAPIAPACGPASVVGVCDACAAASPARRAVLGGLLVRTKRVLHAARKVAVAPFKAVRR